MRLRLVNLPTAEKVDSSGKKRCLNKTKSEANTHEPRVRLNSDSSDTDTRPDNSHETEVKTGSDLGDQHVTRKLTKD